MDIALVGPMLKDFMPRNDDAVACAGTPLTPGQNVADYETVVEALRTIHDPEIPINIYDLGLVYDIDIGNDDGHVVINMTLTAPACPVAGELPRQVAEVVADVDGIGEVEVRLVWEPAWSPDKMSEDARLALGF